MNDLITTIIGMLKILATRLDPENTCCSLVNIIIDLMYDVKDKVLDLYQEIHLLKTYVEDRDVEIALLKREAAKRFPVEIKFCGKMTRKIALIKVLREYTDIGLKDAKYWIEDMGEVGEYCAPPFSLTAVDAQTLCDEMRAADPTADVRIRLSYYTEIS